MTLLESDGGAAALRPCGSTHKLDAAQVEERVNGKLRVLYALRHRVLGSSRGGLSLHEHIIACVYRAADSQRIVVSDGVRRDKLRDAAGGDGWYALLWAQHEASRASALRDVLACVCALRDARRS